MKKFTSNKNKTTATPTMGQKQEFVERRWTFISETTPGQGVANEVNDDPPSRPNPAKQRRMSKTNKNCRLGRLRPSSIKVYKGSDIIQNSCRHWMWWGSVYYYVCTGRHGCTWIFRMGIRCPIVNMGRWQKLHHAYPLGCCAIPLWSYVL